MTDSSHHSTPEVATSIPEFDAARLRRLVDAAPDALVVVDGTGTIKWASPASLRVFGTDYPALVGRSILELCAVADDRERLGGYLRLIEATRGLQGPFPITLAHPDGTERVLEAMLNNQLHEPDLAGVVVTVRDVSHRWEGSEVIRTIDPDQLLSAENSQSGEFGSLLESMARGLPLKETLRRIVTIVETQIAGSSPMVGVLDDDGWFRFPVRPTRAGEFVDEFNAMPPDTEMGSALRVMGVEPVISTDLAERPRSAPLAGLVEEYGFNSAWTWPAFSNQDPEQLVGVLMVLHPEARPPTDAERVLLERSMDLAAIAIDRHHLRSALDYRAQHDTLTGLPNRASLLDQIGSALVRTRQTGRSVAVLFIDLDRFKLINDSLGHAVGDLVLEQVASRFRAALRPHDVVGRFGGDEFVVVCDAVADSQMALTVADRLRAALAAPFIVDDRKLVVTASIGIAETSDPDTDPDALIRDADVALYRAKNRGRDTSVVFQSGDQERVVRALDIEHRLRLAIENEELAVHYQPVVQSVDGALVGLEALVRWHDPVLGHVSPAELIPVAEESGLILGLGSLVLRQASELAAGWPSTPGGALPWVSVNVSALQFADSRFIGEVAEALDRSGLDPKRLCLELTETAFVGDDAVAVGALVGLKALGVRIAIDDFGTGHASLDYVRRFAVADALKVDRSFVAGVGDDAGHDRAIIAAVVALGRALGFAIIAEGVETDDQRQVLLDMGCEFAQGYHFARPMPADEVTGTIAAGLLPLT